MTRVGKIGQEFICAACGESFINTWTHDDAAAEHKEKYPDEIDKELATVCDSCYAQVELLKSMGLI